MKLPFRDMTHYFSVLPLWPHSFASFPSQESWGSSFKSLPEEFARFVEYKKITGVQGSLPRTELWKSHSMKEMLLDLSAEERKCLEQGYQMPSLERAAGESGPFIVKDVKVVSENRTLGRKVDRPARGTGWETTFYLGCFLGSLCCSKKI